MTAPRPRLLLLDADPARRAHLHDWLHHDGHAVTAAENSAAALDALATTPCAAVLAAIDDEGTGARLLEAVHAHQAVLPVLVLAGDGLDTAALLHHGAAACLTQHCSRDTLRAELTRVLATGAADDSAGGTDWRAEIVSRSTAMHALLSEARLVAGTDASVLIRGASGTGKELLARALHRASPRAARAFVAINCAAIPEHLLESELFGHRRGAFTGAHGDHPGLLREADGGTLFLDEIGDMPLALQAKLLRVLQERSVRALGSSRNTAVDVRIISATHHDLQQAMAAGSFRADLYYRLKVVALDLPALERRREDIPLLAAHFLARAARRFGRQVRGFAPRAMEELLAAAWPGNVRQLQNVVEQVCALCTSALVPRHLVARALDGEPRSALCSYEDARRRFEHDYLSALLRLTGGNVTDAARLAARNRTEFYRLLQRNGLRPEHFRPSGEHPAGALWA